MSFDLLHSVQEITIHLPRFWIKFSDDIWHFKELVSSFLLCRETSYFFVKFHESYLKEKSIDRNFGNFKITKFVNVIWFEKEHLLR